MSIQIILEKGGEFISLIHPSEHIGDNAKISKGCIIYRNIYVGVESIIGDYVLIQFSGAIGHDVKIGNYTRFDCFAVCIAGVEIGDEVTVHILAVINENVVVENKSKVGACSFVIN